MRKRFALFVGGANCYANRSGFLKDGLTTYYFSSAIGEDSTFATEKEAVLEACRIDLTQFTILPVYFR